MNMRMKYRDITISDDPFGLFNKTRKIQMVYDPYRSISSPGTKNGTNGIIIKHLLKVQATLLVCSGKLMMLTENMRTKNHFQTVFLEYTNTGMHLIKSDAARRGDNADFISFDQIGRLNHHSKINKTQGICIFVFASKLKKQIPQIKNERTAKI